MDWYNIRHHNGSKSIVSVMYYSCFSGTIVSAHSRVPRHSEWIRKWAEDNGPALVLIGHRGHQGTVHTVLDNMLESAEVKPFRSNPSFSPHVNIISCTISKDADINKCWLLMITQFIMASRIEILNPDKIKYWLKVGHFSPTRDTTNHIS